jgi:dolichyl-phosphate-mannose--protein O-mannosyl transferase
MFNCKKLLLTALFCVSIVLFFYHLGNIPQGISIDEARFGLKLASIFGTWVLDPFWVRFPNALLGTLVVFIFFLTLKSLKFDFKTSISASCILLITPWFFSQTRIFSVGILPSALLLLFFIAFSKAINRNTNKFGLILIIGSMVIFTLSLFRISDAIKEMRPEKEYNFKA